MFNRFQFSSYKMWTLVTERVAPVYRPTVGTWDRILASRVNLYFSLICPSSYLIQLFIRPSHLSHIAQALGSPIAHFPRCSPAELFAVGAKATFFSACLPRTYGYFLDYWTQPMLTDKLAPLGKLSFSVRDTLSRELMKKAFVTILFMTLSFQLGF